MDGLGDTIYVSPIFRFLAGRHGVDLVLRTAWPQIFRGLPRTWCAPSETDLRTQARNVKRMSSHFSARLSRAPLLENQYRRLRYPANGKSMWRALCELAGVDPSEYFLDLRSVLGRGSSRHPGCVVIRPATVRLEWPAPGRNCRPEYLQAEVDAAKASGATVVAVADLEPGVESAPPLRGVDHEYLRGELDLDDIADLVRESSRVICPVGFMVPLSVAMGARCRVIHGGCGGNEHPDRIDAPGAGTLEHILPDEYCMCLDHRQTTHRCNKRILRYERNRVD